jgi:hypothetical protein
MAQYAGKTREVRDLRIAGPGVQASGTTMDQPSEIHSNKNTTHLVTANSITQILLQKLIVA